MLLYVKFSTTSSQIFRIQFHTIKRMEIEVAFMKQQARKHQCERVVNRAVLDEIAGSTFKIWSTNISFNSTSRGATIRSSKQSASRYIQQWKTSSIKYAP